MVLDEPETPESPLQEYLSDARGSDWDEPDTYDDESVLDSDDNSDGENDHSNRAAEDYPDEDPDAKCADDEVADLDTTRASDGDKYVDADEHPESVQVTVGRSDEGVKRRNSGQKVKKSSKKIWKKEAQAVKSERWRVERTTLQPLLGRKEPYARLDISNPDEFREIDCGVGIADRRDDPADPADIGALYASLRGEVEERSSYAVSHPDTCQLTESNLSRLKRMAYPVGAHGHQEFAAQHAARLETILDLVHDMPHASQAVLGCDHFKLEYIHNARRRFCAVGVCTSG